MSLGLQQDLIMMSKYSKFGVDIFNTFWVMSYIKVLHDDDDNDNNSTFSSKQTSSKTTHSS